VLVEVGAEVEAAVHTALVARADEAASLDHVVQAIEAGRGEVLIVRVHLEAWQRAEVVLRPLPGVAEHIVEALRYITKKLRVRYGCE
jgi:hypothetical protein